MSIALLSLGSNVLPEQHLAQAIAALQQQFQNVRISPVYRTPAVGFTGPDFLNCAAQVETDLDVYALNHWLHALEDAQGRRRDVPRFSDRTLDIDIIFFDDLIVNGPGNLKIPRPELKHEFVLKPLVDIAPDFIDPTTGQSLAMRWRQQGGNQPTTLQVIG